jgi:hypothetical protein
MGDPDLRAGSPSRCFLFLLLIGLLAERLRTHDLKKDEQRFTNFVVGLSGRGFTVFTH